MFKKWLPTTSTWGRAVNMKRKYAVRKMLSRLLYKALVLHSGKSSVI